MLNDIRYVGTEYGGFPVCMSIINDGDIIYDFGVGEDISFSEGVVAEKKCHVHLFDFTPQSIQWFKDNHSDRTDMTFHEYGLSDHDGELAVNHPKGSRRPAWLGFEHNETWPVKRLKSVMEELGHDHIDVLKLDIEGEEYKVIDDMFDDEIFPKQICIEVHQRFLGDKLNLHVDVVERLKKHYDVLSVHQGIDVLWINKNVINDSE